MASTTKTTIYLDASDYRRLQAIAHAEGRPAAELVREAVSVYVSRRRSVSRPASIGRGHSGRGDLSERAEELLAGMRRKA
jgi:predicted transcriptional regulator